MRRCTWLGIATLLAVMPTAGQQIIQRMERDVVVANKLDQPLEKAPLLELDVLKKIALFSRFGRELRSEEEGILRRTALRLSQRDFAAAQKDWELALGKMKEREFKPDLDALVQGVLRQAYFGKDSDFQPLAAAVQFREEQREAAYRERERLERLKAKFDEGAASSQLQIRPLRLPEEFAAGVRPVQWAEPVAATAKSVAEELQQTVALCAAADGNVEKSVADLRKALEGHVLQTMSNAAKMLHDSAKAIIQNMKA